MIATADGSSCLYTGIAFALDRNWMFSLSMRDGDPELRDAEGIRNFASSNKAVETLATKAQRADDIVA